MRPGLALGATLAGALLIWCPVEFDGPTLAVWNASASAPIGLYRVSPTGSIGVGDRVLVDAEPSVVALLSARGYVPAGIPLIKTVAAVAPSRVCRDGLAISIDGRFVARARSADRAGRPLPAWGGCRILGPDQVFLLTADVPDSLDGRYFGPTERGTIRGRVTPVWTLRTEP